MSTGEVIQLTFSEGVATNPPTQTVLGSVSSFAVYATDAAFVSAKGSAATDGDAYKNSTDGAIHYYNTDHWETVDEINDIYICNGTGSIITKGQTVYINGTSGGVPTVALSKADNETTAHCLGMAKAQIGIGAYGFIVASGIITGIDTSTYTTADEIYVSETVAGGIINARPTTPGTFHNQIGRVVVVNATTGTIYLNTSFLKTLNDITDVNVTSPVIDETLRYNGIEWVNGPASTSSASAGITFFNATPNLIATGAENDVALNSLSKTPVTTAEQTISATAASNTVTGFAWLYDTALARTSIDAGLWDFTAYAAVNSVAGGRVTTLTRTMYKVSPYTSPTITTTGAGTSRTCTASGGTPFAAAKVDASATNTTASYVQTPKGLYQITARSSDTEVTILVPVGYVNESTIAFSVWKKLFAATSAAITSTSTNYTAASFTVAETSYSIDATDKLGTISFVTSNNTTTLTLTYNGTSRNTHFQTPLITLHNNLAGLQGGAANDYYHMTLVQLTVATQAASGSQNGYLSSGDWTTFNSKQAALGFTAENVANKNTSTSLGTSDTAYPSQNAVKVYVDTAVAAAGGGGGGTLSWSNDGPQAWEEVSDASTYYQKAFKAIPGGSQKLYCAYKVASNYVAGTALTLKNKIFTKASSGNLLLTAVATLIRSGTDPLSDTTNQITSTNTAQAIDTANKEYLITLDITQTGGNAGKINGVALSANDTILIYITRGTDTCTGDLYFMPSTSGGVS